MTPYHAIANPKSNTVVLNSNHSYFLLVDNGTVGKYGSEILLRKKLEKYISEQRISTSKLIAVNEDVIRLEKQNTSRLDY